MDIFHIDNANLLTTIDKFSRYVEVYPMQARNTKNVLDGLKQFMSRHGVANKIIHDPGMEFEGNDFTDFLKLYGINNHTTCARNSTGNSTIERFHSTLIELMLVIKQKFPNYSLTEKLNLAVLTYNNSIHNATKLTPFEVIRGIRENTVITPVTNNIMTNYSNQHNEDMKFINT